MKLRFKHQDFQLDATNAVCDLFQGQPHERRTFVMDKGVDDAQTRIADNTTGWANAELHLREAELCSNLRAVQKQRNILPSASLMYLKCEVEWEDNRKETVTRPAYTIEMETGTGKTYTYIKTMYELNARYGWSKFIIVVPSVAIREGVASSFRDTAEHFKEEYGKVCRHFIYNSSRLNELEQFADDPGINVMIINSQAFNASGQDARRIYMKLDSFRSRRPIDVIASVNPIVIVDEPQSVLGEQSAKKANATRHALGKFKPLFFLLYSATHREEFNMVYRLDAVDAYQKQLVKKIAVKGVTASGTTATNSYIYLQKINTYPNKSPTVTIMFDALTASGIQKKTKILSHGDNIYLHSGEIESYRDGFTITDIQAGLGYVDFLNGVRLQVGEVIGDVHEDDVRRIQIRETISSHLEREQQLFQKGIKVLSLFFIDEVAKYKSYDEQGEVKGMYARIFEEEYRNALELLEQELSFDGGAYLAYLQAHETPKIHAGYFSIDKKGKLVDSKVNRREGGSDDVSAYDLIMKDKQRLLSFEEPVRFLFSHSALREGWDNPNVFQICTLRRSEGEIKKRQELGRGLRLCVNRDGERMDAEELGEHNVHDINVLTVIANESYETFAKSLQDEMAEITKNRPLIVTKEFFEGRLLHNMSGEILEVDNITNALLYHALKQSGVIEKDGHISLEYYEKNHEQREQILKDAISGIDQELAEYAPDIRIILESVYNPSRDSNLTNARAKTVLHLNQEKFASKQFKELWETMNAKTYYTVSFNEEKLIESCVRSLDANLRVTATKIVINQGYLEATKQQTPTMKKLLGSEVVLEELASKGVRYDLIGEIATPTELTRKATAEILRRIQPSTFKQFSTNPEDFIRKVTKLIKEQKASTVIEHITYNTLEESWTAEEIFVDPTISGEYGQNITETRKHLYDKLRYDSGVEKKLAEEMDVAEAVELYVKLPSGFYIHTPMGKYNPDWAIAFREGGIKHIYFVAESKGSDNELQLRGIENAKIECARRHFAAISSDKVKYGVVSTFEDLLEMVRS